MDKDLSKVLITGATGLVGSRLLPRLINAGFDCTALVRVGSNTPRDIKIAEGDILDADSLQLAFQGITAIIHLAAVFRTDDTDMIWKSNFEGTRNLINATKMYAPNARFILASTAHVYNADNPHPGREGDQTNPEHAYPASKLAAEKVVEESGLNWSILRFPFVYGDDDGHLAMLPKHVMAAKWHPAMKMSTVHHLDIAIAIQIALKGDMDKKTVNITDDATLSVYELLQLAGTTMDSSSAPLVNPWYLHIDGSLARRLGFQPKVRTVYQAVHQNLI